MEIIMADELNGPFHAIVIGSGFGGAVAITELSDRLPKGKRILVLERGTWWRNPEGPGLRKSPVKDSTKPPPKKAELTIRGEWQYWARPNDSSGLVYVARSLYKEGAPLKDNDLAIRKNRKGLYRITRFSHKNGNVDVVSGSAVGGGSLFYSGVNLIPHQPVLERIGLDHLASKDFRNAGDWMGRKRGAINKINTKIPVPAYVPQKPSGEQFQLSVIPESRDTPVPVEWEMPNPIWNDDEHNPRVDADFMLLDRARVLKRAMNRVERNGGFGDATNRGTVWKRPAAKDDDGFEPLPLSVVEYDPRPVEKDGRPRDSMDKNTFCSRDGRCILGCLPSARHTIYKTIMKQNEKPGNITVLPLTKVSHISKSSGGGPAEYIVHFESDDPDVKITSASAPLVFLAAGCLGTTEIMLRTQRKHEETNAREGLALSRTVGTRFSTNGDFFAFTRNIPRDFNTSKIVPDKERIGNPNPTDGPINSSHFYVTFGTKSNRVDINVEDAGIPTTFARVVHSFLPDVADWKKLAELAKVVGALLLDNDPYRNKGIPDPEEREQDDYLTDRELVSNVFFYNLMGSGPDEPFGTFSLQRDGAGLELAYPNDRKLHEWVVFRQHEMVLKQLSEQMFDPGDKDADGRTERRPILAHSPFWLHKDKRVTVVHPLGGCPIGADATKGTIDRDGRVFDGSTGNKTDVHDGLYVVDASAIPGALAVNPTFTIVTHAVRCLRHADLKLDE
jgi:choline dehydrogenase-like flavoprotein